MRSPIISSLSR